jgi:hypothetical protein
MTETHPFENFLGGLKGTPLQQFIKVKYFVGSGLAPAQFFQK